MKKNVVLIFLISLSTILISYSFSGDKANYKCSLILNKSSFQDTCIIDGMCFEINNEPSEGLKGIVQNGRIKIIAIEDSQLKFRVIRYVFSIYKDENVSSIRQYGDLVSYPIINLLKDSETGDQFHFEDIIIVDQSKEIKYDAIRPIIIKRK